VTSLIQGGTSLNEVKGVAGADNVYPGKRDESALGRAIGRFHKLHHAHRFALGRATLHIR
jgi:hypothetical protein